MKIALNIHVPLNTETKLFCSCSTKPGSEPNTTICEYCASLPGSRPRLNGKAFEYALKIGVALGCKFPEYACFSRKISAHSTVMQLPIALDGFFKVNNTKIGISSIQLKEEEAAVKSSANNILLDFNESGLPVCEISTRPDFVSPSEVRIFLQHLSSILQYLNVCNPQSAISVDANIFASRDVQIRNLKIKDVFNALTYEITRKANENEVREWDSESCTTRACEIPLEGAYLATSDLPLIKISRQQISEIEKSLPELAEHKLERYVKEYGIGLDLAISIINDPDMAEMFEEVIKKSDAQLAARWFAGEIKKTLNYNNQKLKDTKLRAEHVIKLLKLVKSQMLTEASAELILREMISRQEDPEQFLEGGMISRIYDENVLTPVVKDVMNSNAGAILDYKSGKQEAINFLVGAVMKKTKGRADSEATRKILVKFLN